MAGRYDQWDIVSSVGLTALVVAAGRAVDTHREDGLISDPYAEAFVTAADPPTPLATRPVDPSGEDGDDPEQAWQMMSGYLGVRTRYFDEYFAAAVGDGIRQVVVLAAGLDTRAYRLDWPAGTTVFEIDQPAVLDFKRDVLAGQGAEPRCDRRPVAVDLRDDWPAALDEAGFDRDAPTAWLAEGLLPYLPAAAEEALLEEVVGRSAVGSRVEIENFSNVPQQLDDPTFRQVAASVGVNMADLVHTDDRPDPGDRLAAHGWEVETEVARDVAVRWDRPFDALAEQLNGLSAFVTARRPG